MTKLTPADDHEITALSSGKFIATESGLIVKGQPTFDEWMTYGKNLHRVNRALQMVIGDWLNEGEARFGERYSQATTMWPDMQLETLRNWKWVASRVGTSLRNDTLHYSHYAVVAPLPEPEQAEWLTKAAKKKLTSKELRQAIQGSVPPPAAKAPIHVLRGEFLTVCDALDDLVERDDIPEPARPHVEQAHQAMSLALSALERAKVK